MIRKALLLGMLSIFAAGQASAKILDTWTRISTQFTNLARAEASDTGVGVTTLSTTGSGMHLNTLSVNALEGLSIDTTLPVTDPIVSNGGIVSVRLSNIRPRPDILAGQNGNPGVLGPISGAIQSTTTPAAGLGTIPITGLARICLLAIGCASNLPFDFGATVNGVAEGVGVGGLMTIGQLGTIRISLLAAPYTVKTVTAFNRTNNGAIDTYTEKGFAHGPLSNTSSTGQTSGVLQVVTATHISIAGVPGNTDIGGVFNRMVVHFVPEPGLLLLLGSGAVGMALLGRKRIRR